MWEIFTFGLDCLGFALVTLIAIHAAVRILGTADSERWAPH